MVLVVLACKVKHRFILNEGMFEGEHHYFQPRSVAKATAVIPDCEAFHHTILRRVAGGSSTGTIR